MGEAAQQFPDDDDIATLYAESLMDLSPWAYWNAHGQPTPVHRDDRRHAGERCSSAIRDHIGATHYYIHAVEASNDPKRAEPYADRSPRSRPVRATWCTCRRTSTSASAATTTRR